MKRLIAVIFLFLLVTYAFAGNEINNGVQSAGDVTIVTGTLPIANGGTGQTTARASFDALKQPANDSYSGTTQYATDAQAAAGTNDSVALTPANTDSIRVGADQVDTTVPYISVGTEVATILNDSVTELNSHEAVAGNDTVSGHIQTATDAQVQDGTNDSTAVTPAGLASVGFITALGNDATPELGGNLGLNGNDITGTGNINITGSVSATLNPILFSWVTDANDTITDADSNYRKQIANDSSGPIRITFDGDNLTNDSSTAQAGLVCRPSTTMVARLDTHNIIPVINWVTSGSTNDSYLWDNESSCVAWTARGGYVYFDDPNTYLTNDGAL